MNGAQGGCASPVGTEPPDFLFEMIENARRRVDEARRARPLARPPRAAAQPHRLLAALRSPRGRGMAVIAEVKRSSPSRGALCPALDAAGQAHAYEAAGADAVSVLTEPTRFAGSLADLQAAASSCSLPVLRKDFIVDAYQIWEAAVADAAAVLLIVAALDDRSLHALLAECEACGLDALVEVHDNADLRRALALRAPLIGLNNRDLRTLEVDLRIMERLAPLVPAEVLLVGESGIASGREAQRAAMAGVRAVLVGEALVRCSHDRLPDLVTELRGWPMPITAPRGATCATPDERPSAGGPG